MVSNKLLFVCFTSIAFIYFTMKSTVTYLDSRLRILDPGPRTPDSGLWTLDRNVRIRTLFVIFLRKALFSQPVPLHSGELMATCELLGQTEEKWGRGGTSNRLASFPGRVAMSCRFTTQKP